MLEQIAEIQSKRTINKFSLNLCDVIATSIPWTHGRIEFVARPVLHGHSHMRAMNLESVRREKLSSSFAVGAYDAVTRKSVFGPREKFETADQAISALRQFFEESNYDVLATPHEHVFIASQPVEQVIAFVFEICSNIDQLAQNVITASGPITLNPAEKKMLSGAKFDFCNKFASFEEGQAAYRFLQTALKQEVLNDTAAKILVRDLLAGRTLPKEFQTMAANLVFALETPIALEPPLPPRRDIEIERLAKARMDCLRVRRRADHSVLESLHGAQSRFATNPVRELASAIEDMFQMREAYAYLTTVMPEELLLQCGVTALATVFKEQMQELLEILDALEKRLERKEEKDCWKLEDKESETIPEYLLSAFVRIMDCEPLISLFVKRAKEINLKLAAAREI